jgi:hypothetical protein
MHSNSPRRPRRHGLTILTAVAVVALTVSTFALFTNGGFESGDFTGWTKSTFTNWGLTGSQPFSGASIVRTPTGGVDRTTVEGPAATPMSLSDPIVAAVQYPRFGQHAARVNYWPSGGAQPGRVANSLLQQSVVTPGDVDPDDGLVHARFAAATSRRSSPGSTSSSVT